MELFTVAEARAELARMRPVLEELVALRADAAELAAALNASGTPTRLGGIPELKAAQARLDEMLAEVRQAGAEVKGLAPLLLDFPAELDDSSPSAFGGGTPEPAAGRPVLLCWLEGEPELRWYHRRDLGFAGRRRLT